MPLQNPYAESPDVIRLQTMMAPEDQQIVRQRLAFGHGDQTALMNILWRRFVLALSKSPHEGPALVKAVSNLKVTL